MQYSNKDYNPEKHDRWRALTVKQPYANDLVTEAYKDENGIVYGKKTIEVRSKNTSYRGDVLICSAASPVYPGMESGVTLGLVELYDVKPIKEFTPEDWENTRIPKEKRAKITKGYGWLMRNPRRVIEMPIKGQLGIYNLVYTKDCILPYPVAMVMDKKGYELARKEVRNDTRSDDVPSRVRRVRKKNRKIQLNGNTTRGDTGGDRTASSLSERTATR